LLSPLSKAEPWTTAVTPERSPIDGALAIAREGEATDRALFLRGFVSEQWAKRFAGVRFAKPRCKTYQ
jgi:hypothetical protein